MLAAMSIGVGGRGRFVRIVDGYSALTRGEEVPVTCHKEEIREGIGLGIGDVLVEDSGKILDLSGG